MPKVAPAQTSFNGGEFSPLLYGRVDADRYKTGGAVMLNRVPMVQGALLRRPPTRFVKEVKTSSLYTRVLRFEFSTTQAYIIEFGNLYCRFYKDHGNIESSPGVPAEIVTTYATADLATLKFAQSADTLYVAHQGYPPRKITRTSHTAWSISTISFLDGPYLSQNTTATTLTLSSAVVGAVTVTASAALFAATDVGRLIRFKSGGTTWAWLSITGFTSTTVVSATLMNAPNAAAATTTWRLGVWSATTGYPGAVTFFEDRLFWAGATGSPQRIDGSNTGDYENYAPSDSVGTIGAANAVAYTLNANDVNVVRWLCDDEKGLIAGTPGGVWVVRPSSQSEALTPTNVRATRSVKKGAAAVQPAQIGGAALFLQRAGRKVLEFMYTYATDGFSSGDLTEISEHITSTGLIEFAYQQEPISILWAPRTDGKLIGLSYDRNEQTLRAGWHRHIIGGAYSGGDAVVESVACIPAPDGTRDELWLVVKRTINGSTKRYIEYMDAFWMHDEQAQVEGYFVDCSLAYSGVPATVFSGLDHLEGETVSIVADGAAHPTKVVTAGAVTLDRSASVVYIGFGYNSDLQLLRIEAGAADGTALGKTRRIHRLGILMYRSLGLKIGRNFTDMDTVIFRTAGDDLGVAPPLFSGIHSEPFPGDYDMDGPVCLRQDQPLPSVILAVMPQMETQDRG